MAYDENSLQAAIEGTNIRELGELMRQQSLLEEEYARKRAVEEAGRMKKAMRRDGSGSSLGDDAGFNKAITMLALDKRKDEEVPDLLEAHEFRESAVRSTGVCHLQGPPSRPRAASRISR